MDSSRAFLAWGGDAGREGREPARSGVGALGANFAHQRSEEIGLKRGRDEKEKRRKEVAIISYPSSNQEGEG